MPAWSAGMKAGGPADEDEGGQNEDKDEREGLSSVPDSVSDLFGGLN